jgi:hypothetical protein
VNYLKIAVPIIIVVIIIGVIIVNPEQEIIEEKIETEWRESGPFSIEKHEYYLGEKIFLTVNNIPKDVSGEVIFFRPTSTPNVEEFEKLEGISKDIISTKTKYLAIQFSGENKQNFNRYFEPSLNEWKKICSRNDLVGEWVIVFYGTQYEDMSFKILNQTMKWDERTFETITNKGRC